MSAQLFGEFAVGRLKCAELVEITRTFDDGRLDQQDGSAGVGDRLAFAIRLR